MYKRVIPRDLFNEAKLLKCVGQLALCIHDGIDANRVSTKRLSLKHLHPETGFQVVQNSLSGDLLINNMVLLAGRENVAIFCNYNSREPYPLCFEVELGPGLFEGPVFNDDGTFSDDFVEMLEALEAL